MSERTHLVIISGLAFLLAAPVWAQTPSPPAPSRAPRPTPERLYRMAAELAPAPEVDANRSTQVFQVTLLLASTSGQSSSDLPKAAREAVESLADFLPYKSYSVLDFAWVRTAGMSHTRIKGPDDRTFRAVLRYDDPEENEGRLFLRDFRLEEVSDEQPLLSPGSGSRFFVDSGKALISTSFGMEIGETVVVGTSRLNGDGKALVVLLTAIPASVAGR